MKKVLSQLVPMNSRENQERRADLVKKMMDASGMGKTWFMDETYVHQPLLKTLRGDITKGCSLLCEDGCQQGGQYPCHWGHQPNRPGLLGAAEMVLSEGGLL